MARVTGNLELDGTVVKLNQGATTSQSLVAGTPSVASQVRLPNETDANTEVVTTFSNNAPSKRVKFDTSAASASTTLTISSAQTTSQTLNIPNLTATDSLVLAASAQELSNKTLVDPVVKTGSDTVRLQTTTGNTSPGATIVLDPNNASRTLNLSGNLTLGANLTTNSHALTINAVSGGSTLTLPTTVNLGANLTTNSNALTINAASGGSTLNLPSTTTIGAPLTTNSNDLTINSASGGSTLTLPTTANFSGGNVSTSGSVTIGANFTTNSHALTFNAASGGSTVDVPASGTLLSMASNLTTLPNTGNTTINHASSAELTFGSNISKVVIANNLEVQGTTTTINTTNLAVTDNNITLNNAGTKSSAAGAGLTVDSSGDLSPWTTAPALLYNDALTSGWELRKGDSTASELMTAARTLVQGSHNYGATTTFNSSGGHSLIVQVSGNDRLRLESTNAQLQVSNNTLSATDNTVALSTGSGTGNLTLTTTAGATTGNISVDTTAAGGAGNIDIAAKGSVTLQGTSLSVHSSTPVTVNNDTGNVVRTNRNTPSSAIEIGTTNSNRVDIFTNNVKRAEFPSNPTADGEFRISGTRALRLPVGNDTSERPTSPATGMIRFNTTSNKFEGYNGTAWGQIGGSGQGGINYIENSDAEDTTTTGWNTYADAAASTPVDGTGGSPTVTFTSVTSSPIRGTRSFLLSKDAANRQGQGVSYNFTIDPADTGKQLTISLDYRTSAAYASGDVRVFIYDVTNSVLIYPAVIDLPKYDTAGSAYSFKTSFVSSTSTSYRLIFHVATTNASAYDIRIDNVRVGPDQLLHSTPVTEWQTYTPVLNTGALGTTATNIARWRRVGSDMEIEWSVRQTSAGTAGSGTYNFSIPAGYTIDSSKVSFGFTATSAVGEAHLYLPTDFEITTGHVAVESATTLYVVTNNKSSGTVVTAPIIWGSSFYNFANADLRFKLTAKVPIAQWAGSTVSVDNSQVEYAYNTTAWGDSSDTNPANTGYGPQGAAFNNINLTTFRTRRVRFLTPIQPTDDIDVQFSEDGGKSFLSVAKGSAHTVNGYIIPRFTYVTSSAAVDTHGIGVRIVNASTGEVDVLLGRYAFLATDGSPTREWGDEVNSNYRWRVVKSRNPLTIGGLTGTLWQRKVLTADVTTAGSTIYQFNNLEIGKTYAFYGHVMVFMGTTGTYLVIDIEHNGIRREGIHPQVFTAGASLRIASFTFRHIFVAEATSIRLFLFAKDGDAKVIPAYGGPPAPYTSAFLEELPLHQQTSKWT